MGNRAFPLITRKVWLSSFRAAAYAAVSVANTLVTWDSHDRGSAPQREDASG